MLISPTTNDYSIPMKSSSATSQTPIVRIRTLHVCEPSFPTRDIVRQENYIRRKAQEQQGWCCPRTIAYQGIDPVRASYDGSNPVVNERTTNTNATKTTARISSAGYGSSKMKSETVIHDENTLKTQFETNIRRLHTAHQRHMKKSSDILKRVQLGHSVKDAVETFPRSSITRINSAEAPTTSSATNEEKESDVLYDRLLDDFEEDEEAEGSSDIYIRDDIMSPRTVTTTNATVITETTEIVELRRSQPNEISFIPTQLCQSAPPLNRNNLRQVTLRPFTPRYSGLSARLRLTKHMPFRDVLYRQLCCILWLLRAMSRSDWSEAIGGCWNIDQWLRNDSHSNATSHHHHHQQQQQQAKKHESKTFHIRLPPETKATLTTKDSVMASLRSMAVNNDNSKKHQNNLESSFIHLSESNADDQTGRRSMSSDANDKLDLQLGSTNVESDFNESSSSRSNPGDTIDSANIENNHSTTNLRSVVATPAVFTNTSRTSTSTLPGQSTARATMGRLAVIAERRKRSPDVLLKRWIKNQKIPTKDAEEPIPLSATQMRLLRVGDNDDLKRMFGLENTTDINKEQAKIRRTRDAEHKLVTNIKRRPMTTIGTGRSKHHAKVLSKIKKEFNDFTEEQSIILNNKLEQADNDRLFYCQTKLRELQLRMPPLTIMDRLLKSMRYDEDKKKIDAAYLKYQTWYVDLLQMIQSDYSDDHIIMLLLKEIEEHANPNDKPTVIRFKAVLGELRPHEICHPDVMAAIEFMRVHVVRMGNEEFDKFFCKQFPRVTEYLLAQPETTEGDEMKSDIKTET